MGSKLKVLSAKEVITIFASFGFTIHSQKGSHIKLRRSSSDTIYTLIIPNHDPIARGTLKSIINQGSRHIPEVELRKFFYN